MMMHQASAPSAAMAHSPSFHAMQPQVAAATMSREEALEGDEMPDVADDVEEVELSEDDVPEEPA